MKIYPISILFLIALLCPGTNAGAQEENVQICAQANRYVSLKIKGLDKYNDHLAQQQKHLLNKLKRKEKRFAHKLEKNDSAAFVRYQEQNVSYDSIAKLSHDDTSDAALAIAKRRNSTIDSLKKIQSFAATAAGTPQAPAQTAELNKLQGELSYKNYINEQITKRTTFLKSLAGNAGNTIPGFTAIEKDVFYSKARMKVFKDINDEPTAAEDKAMEYLQGTEGFDKAINSTSGFENNGNLLSKNALNLNPGRIGVQSKEQTQNSLIAKFGNAFSGLSKRVGSEVKDWQNKGSEIIDKVEGIKHISKPQAPEFKVNPMRGLPFGKRIDKQYGWQMAKPNAQTGQPAILQPFFDIGFRHTPSLIYGVGIAIQIGLGDSWQTLRLSSQGILFKSFAKWKWEYELSFYAGYERMFSEFVWNNNQLQETQQNVQKEITGSTESVLLGLAKGYNISSKSKGEIQFLYDIFWRQKLLPSPIVIRFAVTKK